MKYFDPNQRSLEKQKSREQDEEDLKSGKYTAQEIDDRNNFIKLLGIDIKNIKIDPAKIGKK
jgi:hypothetical protein